MAARRRRSGVLIAVALALVPLAVAATAFACARLATLKLDRAGAKPGATVNAVGRNFNSAATSSTVKIRLNSRNGAVLWEGRPDSRGRFEAAFTVPDTAAGYYAVLGTQSVASGAPAAGTPARHSFRVRKARASSSKQGTVVAAPVSGAPGGGGPSAPVVLALTAGLLAVLGGAAALTGAARRGRRTALPVTGRAA